MASFCLSCGSALAQDARFCTGCGAQVAAPASPVPVTPAAPPQPAGWSQQAPPPSVSGSTWFALVLALLLSILAAWSVIRDIRDDRLFFNWVRLSWRDVTSTLG